MTKTDIPALMAYLDTQTELRRHDSAKHIAALYKTLRCDKHRGIGRRFLQIIERLEGGPFYSRTLRELLGVHHGVQVGAYSYGQCLVPGAIPRGVKIGRFASIASGVRISLLNKPMDRLAMHPVFYDAEFNGGLETGIQYDLDLRIEADAWIGDSALILPGCHRIGIGAVIGAGSVVTRDVPDFAIVVGNPARVLRYRFDESIQQKILESQWWNHTARDLMTLGPLLFTTVTGAAMQHPLLAGSKTPVPAA